MIVRFLTSSLFVIIILFWCASVWYHPSLFCFLASHFSINTSLSEDISLQFNRWTVHILSGNEIIEYHDETGSTQKSENGQLYSSICFLQAYITRTPGFYA